MENKTESVEELHEGSGVSEAGATLPDAGDDIATAIGGIAEAISTETGTPAPAAEVPAQPPKQLSEREYKELLRKFFTVRHARLTNCGHKFVPNIQPRNNCENCWWTFFNTHKELVELTDKFWAEFGKEALIGMRGKKYVTMFGRFMATVIRLKQEDEALRIANGNQNNEPGSSNGEGTQEGNPVPVATANEGREAEGSDFSFDILEQDVRFSSSTETGQA